MEVVFLGTSGGAPTKRRNMQSLVVRLESGDGILIDCGEGTQQQLLKSDLKWSNVGHVLVTHLHGDHSFGLPGVLCFLDSAAPSGQPLRVAGPVGVRSFLRATLGSSRTRLGRGFVVTELAGGPDDDEAPPELPPHPDEHSGRDAILEKERWAVFDAGFATVDAAPIDHAGVPCVAYRVVEPPRPGKVRAEVVKARATEAGDEPKRIFAAIRERGRADLSDGTSLEPSDVFLGGRATKPGRRVVVFGDCRPARRDAALALAEGADLVVHEATLEDALEDIAYERGHSTPKAAGRLARDARAAKLALWHFSPRYDRASDGDDAWERLFLKQARSCDQDRPFNGDLVLASDFLKLHIPRRA
ncbi:hypothetical protein CTAYLR_003276 [Chrysophaeum taylorii]|uniref:Metallo-beta-lactamase domain-containing protein n=1 Tax=Chrysophaeum taylorii TaxID=2483200 RepID=A0AAD7XMC3_9STRA|nr:hypothetical protein CTAYLR_003276 [Chrysophaeum taylorii]